MTKPLDVISRLAGVRWMTASVIAPSGRKQGGAGCSREGGSSGGQRQGMLRGRRGARLWRGARRGLSLFGSLLAMAVLGTLVLGVVVWLEDRSLEERERLAGGQLETLAHGVSAYVHSRFPALQVQVGGGPVNIGLALLRSEGVLPDGFGDVDALGRGFRVMALDGGGGAVDIVVAETVAAGDTLVPSGALLAPRFGGVRMGVVPPDAPTRVRGPTIDVDVSGFQGNFGGVPAVGALAVLARFDHGSVFGDQLYRVDIPGFAAGNRMETALDLGGNEIVDAGRVEAESLDVSGDIETGGALIVTGALTVGQAVDVTGAVTVTGAMTADRGTFTGTVWANSVEANDSVQAATVTATGTVTAATVAATGALSAGSATIGDLQSATVDASGVNATSVTAEEVSVDVLQATGGIVAVIAGISRLTVGSCSGC